MDKYFSAEISGQPFVLFSTMHWAALAVIAATIALLILWLKRSAGTRAADNFRYCFAAIIFLNQMYFTLWCVFAGIWSINYSLPLQLCDITIFLCAVMLVWNKYFLFEIIYFWGLGGGIQAILTPELAYPFPHSIFFNFFLSHWAILVSILYMMIVKGYRPTMRSLGKAFAAINLYAVFVAAVNYTTGANYMFLCRKPENPSLLDFLGSWPGYLLSLEAVCMVLFFLFYLPFMLTDIKTKKKMDADISL